MQVNSKASKTNEINMFILDEFIFMNLFLQIYNTNYEINSILNIFLFLFLN